MTSRSKRGRTACAIERANSSKRNWRSLSAAAAILPLLIALVVFYTVRLTTARNAAIAEAIRTERIQRFMLNLFDGDEKDAGPAENLRVLTLLDRGLSQARSLDREPLVQAELYQTLGGLYPEARQVRSGRHACSKRRSPPGDRCSGPTPADVVKALIALASLRSDQARFDEAEVFAREALATAKATLPATDLLVAAATAALGADARAAWRLRRKRSPCSRPRCSCARDPARISPSWRRRSTSWPARTSTPGTGI